MIHKLSLSKPVFLLFLGVILTIAASSLCHAQLFLSTDVPVTVGSDSFVERDVMQYQSPNFSLYLSGSILGIPSGTNIDAFGLYGDDILLSVDIPTTLDGDTYTERDLILYDGSNFSKLLDGSAIGIPDGARMDAASVLGDESIVFSLDTPVSFGGISFKANDLIIYADSSFNLYFSGSDHGIPEAADLDGVWVSPSGEILLSLDIPCSINGLEVNDKDIIKWSEGSFSVYFDGLLAGLPVGSDLDALSSGVEPCEGDFGHDGDVDDSDLAVFAPEFGRRDCETGDPCEGDFDDDGDVDGPDFAVFAADFNRRDCPTPPMGD